MKTLKQLTIKFLLLIITFSFSSCGSPDFEGIWVCENDEQISLTITSISKNTYEIKFTEEAMSSVSGTVEDGVLVVPVFGNIERFSIKNGKLNWSGVFADECNVFVKK